MFLRLTKSFMPDWSTKEWPLVPLSHSLIFLRYLLSKWQFQFSQQKSRSGPYQVNTVLAWWYLIIQLNWGYDGLNFQKLLVRICGHLWRCDISLTLQDDFDIDCTTRWKVLIAYYALEFRETCLPMLFLFFEVLSQILFESSSNT